MLVHHTHSFVSCTFADLFDVVEAEPAPSPHPIELKNIPADYFEVQE